MPALYSALTGDEYKQLALKKSKELLDGDRRFSRHIVYPVGEIDIVMRFRFYPAAEGSSEIEHHINEKFDMISKLPPEEQKEAKKRLARVETFEIKYHDEVETEKGRPAAQVRAEERLIGIDGEEALVPLQSEPVRDGFRSAPRLPGEVDLDERLTFEREEDEGGTDRGIFDGRFEEGEMTVIEEVPHGEEELEHAVNHLASLPPPPEMVEVDGVMIPKSVYEKLVSTVVATVAPPAPPPTVKEPDRTMSEMLKRMAKEKQQEVARERREVVKPAPEATDEAGRVKMPEPVRRVIQQAREEGRYGSGSPLKITEE